MLSISFFHSNLAAVSLLLVKLSEKPRQLLRTTCLGRVFACGLLSFALIACEPRGESRSLDEIFVTAKTKFASQVVGDLPAAAEVPLKKVGELLERLESSVHNPASAEYLTRDCASMGENLDILIKMSGYTSRPALGALSASWSGLAHQVSENKDNYESNAVKLLLARTMFSLASELEAVRFGLK